MAKPIIPESAEQEISAIQTDVKSALPASDPWLKFSKIKAVCIGLGRRNFAFYYQLRAMWRQYFPATSTGVFRDMWASFLNISPVVASKSSGYVTATGTNGSTISAGQIAKIGDYSYTVLSTVNVATRSISISSLTRSGTVAMCTTSASHELASGMNVTIAGATETEWNTTFYSINVTSGSTFTFSVPVGYTATTTGTRTIGIATATVSMRSIDSGAATNQDSGVQLTWESTITGVDDTCYVQFAGITGGADADDQDDPESGYNKRINTKFSEPLTLNNPEHIKQLIMGIDKANTRVWVRWRWNNGIAQREEAGCFSAFFVRDGDDNIIPTASYVAAAKSAVMNIMTPNVDEDDVFIEAPLPVSVNITISSVLPATTSMKLAVTAQIDSFFRNYNEEGQNMSIDRFRGFIYQTWDSSAGEQIQSFEMTSPYIDQEVEIGQLAMPGTVSVS